uniref:Uncharacterized protein n=1 Tax=Anopheles melas TaxID=34690 RepID=A0A182UAY4_9DIPT
MIFCTHHVPQLGAGGHSFQSTETLNYREVDLWRKQYHSRHLERVVNKVSRITNALTCLMPNKRGPKSRSRRQLVNVGNSTVYDTELLPGRWVLDKESHRKTVQRAHRPGAFRVASTFQTVSYDAACVVANTTLFVLLMQEDIRCHDEKVCSVQSDIRKRQWEETMRRWQDQWTMGAGQL